MSEVKCSRSVFGKVAVADLLPHCRQAGGASSLPHQQTSATIVGSTRLPPHHRVRRLGLVNALPVPSDILSFCAVVVSA